MKNLLQNLPPSLRQKALMGGAQDESSEDEEELEEETEKGWGSKKAYWSADTTDLEIGQDVQDAEDEEAAAKVRPFRSNLFTFVQLTLFIEGNSHEQDVSNEGKRLLR